MDRIFPSRRHHDNGPRRQDPRSSTRHYASHPNTRSPRHSSSNHQHHHHQPPSTNYNTTGPSYNYSEKAPKERATMRQHFIAMSAEFVGTVMFLYFALAATQVANNLKSAEGLNVSILMYISLAFGFSLATTAWVFYRVSGGLFNPAVTWGMCITGSLPWVRGLLLLPCQILGGIVAAALVRCMFPGPLTAETVLANGTSITQGLFIEMFLTAELELTILFIAVEKQRATFVAPVAIGLALFVAELTGVYFTGGSLNPARSFGPAVANRSFPGHHWIYWLGPFLGASIAGGYYKFNKWLNYEEANPGQDASSDVEAQRASMMSQGSGQGRSKSR